MLPNLKGMSLEEIYHTLKAIENESVYGSDEYKAQLRSWGPGDEEDVEDENGASDLDDFDRWFETESEKQLLDDEQ